MRISACFSEMPQPLSELLTSVEVVSERMRERFTLVRDVRDIVCFSISENYDH